MDENLHFSIPLNENDFNDRKSLTKAIKKAIEEHQNLFLPLLERLIDLGDTRVSVIEDSLNIEEYDVVITSTDCVASGTFDSFYYAGCKDMDQENDHEVDLQFTIEDNSLYFNIELPPAWRPDDYE